MSSRIVSTVAGLLLATSLSGCQATPEPLPAVEPSTKATTPATNEPKGFDPRPTTPEEKEFDLNIRNSLDPDAGPEFQNIYWAVKTYAGIKIKGDTALVALEDWRKAPQDVLFGPPPSPFSEDSPCGSATWPAIPRARPATPGPWSTTPPAPRSPADRDDGGEHLPPGSDPPPD